MRKTHPKYVDIEPAIKNAKDIRFFLENILNFTEIIETSEAGAHDLLKDWRIIEDLCREFHKKENAKLFVFIYYAGHGAMHNYTKLMINE